MQVFCELALWSMNAALCLEAWPPHPRRPRMSSAIAWWIINNISAEIILVCAKLLTRDRFCHTWTCIPTEFGRSEFFPDHILVVTTVDEGVHLAAVVAAEEEAALDARAEEEVAGFGHQQFLWPLASLRVQFIALA